MSQGTRRRHTGKQAIAPRARAGPLSRNPSAMVRLATSAHFDELPGEIRQRLLSHSRCPAELTRVAGALQDAIDTLRGDASSEELKMVATRIAAEVAYAQRILARLTAFSGELGGLAWVVELREIVSGGYGEDDE